MQSHASLLFNLQHDGQILPDNDGQYERNAGDAWTAARRVARDLMQIELSPPIDSQTWHFVINEEGSADFQECPFVGRAAPPKGVPDPSA